ncbi:MAG: serine protease [Pseudorhodoplanes sp.]|uniref:serine protease n=1 Tax=Pseudorhodoplanes sp. TaxID=1934341 RepID=UPI003D0D0E7F
MRVVAWVTVIALALSSQVQAQPEIPAASPAAAKAKAAPKGKARPPKKAAAKKEKKDKPAAPAPAATPAQRAAYSSLPVSERLAIQSDLIWSGDLTGAVDPDFGDRAIAAVRSFQKRNKFEETGILTDEQRQTLATAMRRRKDYNGWQLVEDTVTPGVRLGIPAKLVPNAEIGTTGSRWSSARGEIQIETFREKMAGATLQELFEEMKKRPSNRRVEVSAITASSFTLSGMQGLKKFHVRAFLKDNEARGLTILFDQAMETIMLPLVDNITGAYLPFGDPASASTSRRVEYGSGIVVTPNGHVVTERQLTDDCRGIIVAGLGRADRVAEDSGSDLALIRINGARSLKPVPFSTDPPKSTQLTLVGISEPAAQAGARQVTTVPAKLRGVDGARVLLDAVPARGFVGGAALDGEGRLAGMIDVSSASVAGPAAVAGQASFVPTASIRKFLEGAGITPLDGRGDLAAAKNALVRVICVRK